MTRRGQPLQPRHANLSPEQMRAAIPRLRKRIEELRAVDVDAIPSRDDPVLTTLRDRVQTTVNDIFGGDTVESQQLGYIELDEAPEYIYGAVQILEVRRGYKSGIARTIGKLENLIALFEEKLEAPGGDSIARARRVFGDMELHPDVAGAATQLFEDGHYANAIEDACKALDLLVQKRSGRCDLSGTDLMLNVFSPNKPTLRFNDLLTESDRSEQQGMMFLYAGVMLALRNPRAHGLLQDTPEGALEYVAFVSLLAKALDRARRV